MATAEIVTIGTEILLGEIVDTNARYLADQLRLAGIDVYRTQTVGDNPERIAAALRDAASRSDAVIATGGLGPTVDDCSREALAGAAGVALTFHPDLWEEIEAHFRRYGRAPGQNNRRQAYLPEGAVGISNPVGTAPAFSVMVGRALVFALPGVPREMEYLFENEVLPRLRAALRPKHVLVTRVLHTAGAGESRIDERVADLERSDNPTLGLAARAGQVDLRLTARATSPEAAGALLQPMEEAVRERLGNWVYGADGDTLADVVTRRLAALGLTLAVAEWGLGGRLAGALSDVSAAMPGVFRGGEVWGQAPAEANERDPEALLPVALTLAEHRGADAALIAMALPGADGTGRSRVVLAGPAWRRARDFPAGGHPALLAERTVNLALNLVRRALTDPGTPPSQ